MLRTLTLLLHLIISTSLSAHWAQQTFELMTLQEKIGQMFVVAANSNFDKNFDINKEPLSSALFKLPYRMEPEYIRYLITNCHIGGLIFLYQSTPKKQIEFTNEYQTLSKYPLLIAQDCEWGLSMRLSETVKFPHNMTLGAITDKQLIYKVGKEIGKQCKAIGIHMNCAPVADVNNNPNNPVINNRSFGSNKNKVAEYATLYMHGLQDAGILACAKHFPGHGDTNTDSHFELPVINHSKEHLYTLELYPFKTLIKEGVDAVMTAHLSLPALDSSGISSGLSQKIVTDLLQKELNFDGLTLTDGLGMQAITNHYSGAQAALQSFKAGNTIILCPIEVPEALAAIEKLVKENKEYMELLNKNVLKILKTKERLGIHKKCLVNKKEALAQLHTKEAYFLKKQLFSSAITLIGTNSTIPLITNNTTATVIIGTTHKQNFILPFDSFELSEKPTDNETNTLVKQLTPYKTIVIAIFNMNKLKQNNFGITEQTLNFIKQLNKTKIIALFGSPYSLELFDKKDTLIIAYEDDPDAQIATAEIIMGTRTAQGILPI